jgi:SAM-dependent methyltransferase
VTATAVEVYGDAIGATLDGRPAALRLVRVDGSARVHDVERWVAGADDVDERMLDRCAGPTIDLGCGPGRLVEALALRGVPALGVDVSPDAIGVALVRGAMVLRRDLFRPLPGEGRWGSAILADGNIGIGGDPVRLMRRVARLVGADGRAVVELSVDDLDSRGPVRLAVGGGPLSSAFAWAEVGAPALVRLAAATGWHPREIWDDAGRRFALLDAD